MKKTIIIIFGVMLLFSILTINIETVKADSPTQIFTIDDLYNIRNDLSGDYILMNNLDFQNNDDYVDWEVSKAENTTGTGWLPLSDSSIKFTGSFDGDNYTISDLFIDRDDTDYQSLFGTIGNMVIENLNLVNVNITGKNYVGALVSTVYSDTNRGYIINCMSSGFVLTSSGAGNQQTGGLIGSLYGYNTVKSCYSTVNVTGYRIVGGLIGSISGIMTPNVYIENCYATGDITAEDTTAAGFIGNVATAGDTKIFINNSYSTGFVSAVSGKLGFLNIAVSATLNESNNFFDNQTSGQTTTDGVAVGKYTSKMKNIDTFDNAGWDIVGVPSISSTNYPQLGGSNTWWIYEYLILDDIEDFSADTYNTSTINLSWITGEYTTNTYIEYNNIETWNKGNGTLIYSGDGEIYQHENLDYNTTYYYQAWSYNTDYDIWCLNSVYDNITTDTPFIGLSNLSIYQYGLQYANITVNVNNEIGLSVNLQLNTTGQWITYYTEKIKTGTVYYHFEEPYSNTTYYWRATCLDTVSNISNFTTRESYLSEIYNLLLRQEKEGGDDMIELSTGLMLFLIWAFLIFALIKISRTYIPVSLILAGTQLILIYIISTGGYFPEIIELWYIAGAGFLFLGIIKTFKGIQTIKN